MRYNNRNIERMNYLLLLLFLLSCSLFASFCCCGFFFLLLLLLLLLLVHCTCHEQVDDRLGKGKWAAMLRFLVWHGKWRLIDNAKTFQNLTCSSTESIHTTSSPAAAALVACYRKHLGRPLSHKWRISGYSKDMWKAYRQIPLHEDQMKYCIVIIWHPTWNKWVFSVAHASLMSNALLHASCPGKFHIRCPGNRKNGIFGFPKIRIFGDSGVRESENLDFRIFGNPDFRKSDF